MVRDSCARPIANVSNRTRMLTITQPLNKLKARAREKFNAFIRERDKDKGCITCGGRVEHACHFYPANIYSWLEFDEINTNGGCRECNFYKHPVAFEDHAEAIRVRHGIQECHDLYQRSIQERTHEKRDRQFYLDIIKKYK